MTTTTCSSINDGRILPMRKTMKNVSRRLIAAFALVFATIAIPVHAQDQAQSKPDMKPPALVLEDTSPKGLVPTVEAFKESVKAGGWSILGVTNMAGILSERGFTLHPVLVFDTCSGKYSSKLLARDETRFVASMIPCRVAIYKMSTGKVVISRMNSGAMADLVGGPTGVIIKKSGKEMELIIKATLKKLQP